MPVTEIFLYVIHISIFYKILQVLINKKFVLPTSSTQSYKQTQICEIVKQNQTKNVAVIENNELSRNFISKLFKNYYKHK